MARNKPLPKRQMREMEVHGKMLTTVAAIAGRSMYGMTASEGLRLTEKVLAKRRAARKAQRAARKRNRGR